MELNELADAFAEVSNLRIEVRTLRAEKSDSLKELNALRNLVKKQKRRLDSIKAKPGNVLDHEDELRLYQHSVKFRFNSHINGTKVLKVSAPGYIKSYPSTIKDESSLLKIAMEDLRKRAQ